MITSSEFPYYLSTLMKLDIIMQQYILFDDITPLFSFGVYLLKSAFFVKIWIFDKGLVAFSEKVL